MNDYMFGNYLFSERQKRGLSQTQLAEMLGVTNKAVSKWENGRAKPSTDTLRRLASLFGTDVGELLKIREERKQKSITKIVLTGGPCAGKTTGMSWIMNAFSSRGYRVLFVPETATELISGGVAPWTCSSNLDFQKCLVRLQLEKEKVFMQAASTMEDEKILIVCDRGVMDNKAYMNPVEFQAVLGAMNLDEVALRDEYDGVFHLVTAAKGAEQFYTTEDNRARTETPEQARVLDGKLIAAWTGHPHLRVIGNDTDFEVKMKRLIAEISALLGEPEPLETERKFLVEYPDTAWLESLPNCQKVEIIQTYLLSPPGNEIRIRQRGINGSYTYYQTTKRPAGGISRVEIERRLTQREYLELMMEADPDMHPIRKTRYCLTWEEQYFEIDVFPFWDDQAIVEIELSDENTEIWFPDQLKVIKEVTADESFKNVSLAKKYPGKV